MSLEQLRGMGLLRDESRWGRGHQPSGVVVWQLLTMGAVCVAGCVAIAVGDGGPLTWFGIVGFLAGLFAFIGVNMRGVGRRTRRRGVDAEVTERTS